MALVIVLLALALVQIWGSGGPVQRDGWFIHWQKFIFRHALVRARPGVGFGLLLLGPLLLVALSLAVAKSLLGGFGVLLVSVPVLLYSFGRGNFNEAMSGYLRAWYQGDTEAARAAAGPLLKSADIAGVSSIADPQALHQLVFRAAGYRAFERLFAVLFWFLLLGIPGALMYRLSQLATDTSASDDGGVNRELAVRWLWLLEWLPVRVVGFTLAIVGNFAGCYRVWREHLTCRESRTEDIMENQLEGALGGIDSSECSAGAMVSEGQRLCGAELEAMQGVLSRALLMWLTVMALFVLFGS